MDRLFVEVLDNERSGEGLFQLLQPFTHTDEYRGDIVVPTGFVTDFASIPFFARGFIATAGHSAKAAAMHDYLLSVPDVNQQRWATGVFNRALRENGTRDTKRFIMVAAVAIWTFPKLYLKPLLSRPQPILIKG